MAGAAGWGIIPLPAETDNLTTPQGPWTINYAFVLDSDTKTSKNNKKKVNSRAALEKAIRKFVLKWVRDNDLFRHLLCLTNDIIDSAAVSWDCAFCSPFIIAN